MSELKLHLAKELNNNINLKIVQSSEWSLPVKSIEITFQTVKRSKMDILMKMMLIAFQKAEIRKYEELSELLLVEPLFIKDLIDKMMRTHMIEKNNHYYQMTEGGIEQLKTGIFISEQETHTATVLYSPCHEEFFIEKMKKWTNEEKEIYRYANVFDDWTVSSLDDRILLEALRMQGIETDIGNVQVVITEITAVIEIEVEHIPCIEFRIHNTVEDVIYARVWNTLSAKWDEILEAQLNENERAIWREELRD